MKKTYRIGNTELESPLFLAPLAGFTDAPCRRLCKRYGAALVYTEMVSAKGLYYGDKKTERLLKLYDDELPAAIQIFGSEPDIMAFAAEKLDDRKNSVLDINMGCPVPKIVKNGEGSALLKNPDLIYDIVKAVKSHSSKTVTCKIRTGFGDDFLGLEAAKAIEAAGADALAVHGRTREQYYEGTADWDKIRRIKEAISIPVIGNGDIDSGEKALKIIDETGCDFVMIGRAAEGNPWIFREIKCAMEGIPWEPPSKDEIKQIMIEHYNLLEEEKGEYCAVRVMRKFVGKYTKGAPGSAALRGRVNQITEGELLIQAIEEL